jgi:hypothetical protein
MPEYITSTNTVYTIVYTIKTVQFTHFTGSLDIDTGWTASHTVQLQGGCYGSISLHKHLNTGHWTLDTGWTCWIDWFCKL